MNLYIGNLPWGITDEELNTAFSEFGSVTSAQVISDRETGRSRGFAFVEMGDGGAEAIEKLNGTELGGRRIVVNEAKPRQPRGGGYSD